LPLSDPDAGMYADIGAPMAASGDWLSATTYGVAGPSEWGAHLWPALAGAIGMALTADFGREMFGRGVGLLSGLVLVTAMGYSVGSIAYFFL